MSPLLADVRAMGPGVALRGLYEVSKRAGGHALAFGVLRRTSRAHDDCPIPAGLPRLSLTDASVVRDSTLHRDHVKVFGRAFPLSEPVDWHAALERAACWPLVPWWRIDLRSDERIADVKWTWELGRHAHLVVLARAAAGGDDDALRALSGRLRSWLDQNPPEMGVHWYSNLELALRAIAWVQILQLVGDRLDAWLRSEMTSTLRHAGRHMLVELPYTVSSMRNNHLLGDALGMMVIGETFSTTREGRMLRGIGRRIFTRQLARQVLSDGSMIEDSISYHRFVVEMLAIRMLLPSSDRETRTALERASQFMFRLGVGEGDVPQYGDWDEGRVLAVAGKRGQLLGSARLGLALAGSGAPEEWRDAHEEVRWHATRGTPVPPAAGERDGRDVGGGIARAQRGPFTAWLKVGSQRSHGHADLCSTPVLIGDDWAVCDPGTGTYNGPIGQRNYFRCSIAHNVLRIEGLDQLGPHRAFRWHHSARGVVGPPLRVGDAVVMWGVHDAYRRLDPPRRVARAVFVSDSVVAVADWVEGPPTSYSLSFPLHPGTEWCDGHILLTGGRRVRLELQSEPSRHRGEVEPYDGWWSPTYGHAEPATRLQVEGVTDGPVVWALHEVPTTGVSVRGYRLVVGDDEFELGWREGGAALTHTRADAREVTATVALG